MSAHPPGRPPGAPDEALPARRRHLLAYTAAGIAAAALGGGLAWRRLAGGGDGPVDILFAQRLDGLDGTPQPLSQWRGRPLVVNFWATWCVPCVDEMPELDRLQGELQNHVQFIGIGVDSAANMQKFVQKIPVRYPLLVAGAAGAELSRRLGNEAGGLPFTVVIGADGKVALRSLGRLHIDQLRATLQGLAA
ncbi:TlpA disulfide reductase family protein [Pigmentiphaga soli]|uniref:TlpA disulfide reductase family protein n=1 Tax=Pigmentiphaga soli TaxID=1007095 RepID=A0ABP8GUB6_9BURK